MEERRAKGSERWGSSLRSGSGEPERPEEWDERLHQEGHPTRHAPPMPEPDATAIRPGERDRSGRIPGGRRGRGRSDAPAAARHEAALVGPPPLDKGCGVLWLDRRCARLIRGGGEASGRLSIQRFRGLSEGRPRSTGHSGSVAPGQPGGNPQGHRRGYEAALLQRYYDRIIEALAECERYVIAGPGPAKIELRQRLQHRPAVEKRVEGVLSVEERIGDRELVDRCNELLRR
jgi:hypothetical protein